ncbi:alpha/beta hydrolase [uncultured Shimia sp.]|uniref:alpha/beta hydrolase n=1 Tax=uncultured Shimia sp. TaxID=573152 RepID=UPI00263A2B55|nr:alpha/beta hydrolase [uncultured Shimia sp.]
MKILVRLVVILLVLGTGTVVLGNLAERWVIYPFDARAVAPADVGLNAIEARKITSDGADLVVWVAEPKRGKPVILYFHGNAGNLANRKGRFKHFLDRGYGLVAPAYRGSSGSSGTPSEDALIADAVTVHQALRLKDKPIAAYGESLGTAVVLGLLEALPEDARPQAVILEAPFTSIPALAEQHYPGTGELAEKIENTWRSFERAEALTMPLLILHGTRDDLIPIDMGRQIFAAAPSKEKDFHTVKGAGHTDLWRSGTMARMWRFIDAYALDLR